MTSGTHPIGIDGSIIRRAVAGGAVVLLHAVLLAALMTTGGLRRAPPPPMPARLILDRRPPPPEPRLPRPVLQDVAPVLLPAPDIRVADQAPNNPIIRQGAGPPAAHFGAAEGGGLGLDMAVSAGGGAGARGTLAEFEATVRARVVAHRQQPVLAWDRRNTCVVNYSLRVTASGRLAGFAIDPCAIPEINQAARAAIQASAPFAPPPSLGAASTEVHGSLIFRP